MLLVNRIIVKYDEWGRMGNRMFLYAFGRILSELKNAELCCEPLPNFPNTFTFTPKSTRTDNFMNPVSLRLQYGFHYVNIDELLRIDQDIIVDSFLQNYRYYLPYKDRIQKWFDLDLNNTLKPDADELVIHIRETDYKNLGILIDSNIYIQMIRKLNYPKNTIITDDFESPTVLKLKEIGCQVLSDKAVHTFRCHSDDNAMRDFTYMLQAKHLFIAQSTFSWWAAFLGSPDRVYVPYPQTKGMWKHEPERDDVNLFIPNSHFIKVIE